MRTVLLILVLLLAATSCGVDRNAGRLYLVERDFYRANRSYRDLSIRPQDVADADWAALAGDYEQIGLKYGATEKNQFSGAAGQQMRTMAARALFAAARIRGGIRDSIKVDAIYRDMASNFTDLPAVAGEIAMAQGDIAEKKGRYAEAVDLYEDVVASVAPDPTQPGVPGAVLSLPLHIARLRAMSGDAIAATAAYDKADVHYGSIAGKHRGEILQLEADGFRAEIASDRKDWSKAVRILRDLETQLRGYDKPPRDPAPVIFARSEMMVHAGADPESIRATLATLVHDFPKSKLAPRALLALAANANAQDRVDDSIGYLDQIAQEYKEDEDVVSQALGVRARLLDSRDRWPEALETFRTLTAQHPLSDAALAAPLDIVGHYARSGDETEAKTATADAESHYRDFIERYPPSRFTIQAREGLARTLALQKNYDAAVTEMVKLGEEMSGTQQGANWFAAAAAMARNDLSDSQRAAGILDRMSEVHKNADIGKWASDQARQLREAPAP